MANVVLVAGQKGGVGKTVISIAIAWWLSQRGAVWSGIDTDNANQTFFDLAPEEVRGISFYDEDGFADPEALNEVVDEIVRIRDEDETIIIDVGTGQLNILIAGLRARRLLGKEPVLPITIAYVLLEDSASISTITRLTSMVDEFVGVSWVVMLNERDGPVMQYDGSLTQTALISRGASEIAVPALRDKNVFERLRSSHMTPARFCDPQNGQSWSARCQLQSWLIEVAFRLEANAALFTEQGLVVPAASPTALDPDGGSSATAIPAAAARPPRQRRRAQNGAGTAVLERDDEHVEFESTLDAIGKAPASGQATTGTSDPQADLNSEALSTVDFVDDVSANDVPVAIPTAPAASIGIDAIDSLPATARKKIRANL